MRELPIPAELVAILLAHVAEFGTAGDGRLFRNERGGVRRCIELLAGMGGGPPVRADAQASGLAGRPYDLRHAALSTWLNAGVDPTDVAGNSVEVLLTHYAKCIDGRRDRNNRLIELVLQGDQDPDA